MSKKRKGKPIVQISPIEFFSRDSEEMPAWLASHAVGERVAIGDVLASRTVYYPGSWFDGNPIRTFNKAHAVHAYIYADYGCSAQKVNSELSDDAFKGYHLYHEQKVSREELAPRHITYHITEEEMRLARSGYDMSIAPEDGFSILKIYERDADMGEEHGAKRFAILYIGGDANAVYDVLYGNTDRSPYACIACANMGSGCCCFVKNSLLEAIAMRTNRYPKYLICRDGLGWAKYRMLRTVSGMTACAERFVWVKDAEFKAPSGY